MNIRPNTNTPAATSAPPSLTNGLCHKLPKTHHLDKRAKDIMASQPPDRGHGLDDLLTTKEVAAWFGVSKSMVDNMRSQGGGPEPTPVGGRTIRYMRRNVLAWLESRSRR